MNFDVYSYVFSGLKLEPYYAAASSDGISVFAVAGGTGPGAANILMQNLEDLDRAGTRPDASEIASVFGNLHAVFRQMDVVVSAAGAFSDGTNLYLFNIGNARAFVFRDGYMIMHTEDHSEAYRAFKSGAERAAAYDQIRFQEKRQQLWKVLGFGDDCEPQFYPPVLLEKNLVVLFCTEPFWRYLSVIEMELDYRKSATPEEWLKIMVRRVLMRANGELDHENFAVTAIMSEE